MYTKESVQDLPQKTIFSYSGLAIQQDQVQVQATTDRSVKHKRDSLQDRLKSPAPIEASAPIKDDFKELFTHSCIGQSAR